jgi:hypothetical protein
VQILDRPFADKFFEELRQHCGAELAEIFALVPADKLAGVKPALQAYAAGLLNETSGKDFNLRAATYADKVTR